MRAIVLAPLAALLALSLPLQAQEPPDPGPVIGDLGLRFAYGDPVGEFAGFVDRGLGGNISFNVRLTDDGALGLRADLGFLNYGRESQEACLSVTVGCRIAVDLVTSNDIFFAGIGPQLTLPSGPVRPYITASAGLGYFATHSSVGGTADHDDFASTTHLDDLTFAWSGGGGVLIPVSHGNVPVAIDLSAHYHANDVVRYLREGGIEDLPDGGIALDPIRSHANLLSYRIGVTLGFRRSR